MSWVYWGIVAGLVAMVATLFLCLGFLYSNTKGSSPAPGSEQDEPGAAVTQDSRDYRRAA